MDESPDLITYGLRLLMPDGGSVRSMLGTARPREVGDLVTIPTSAEGEPVAGPGFIWRVVDVEEGDGPGADPVLALRFVRPHSG